MEDTSNDLPPVRVTVRFDPELAAGTGLWVIEWPDGSTTAHGSEAAATAYARVGAGKLGLRVEIVAPE